MKALITGITGQDGYYLAKLLIEKGYEVHGTIRRSSTINTDRIDPLISQFEEVGKLNLHYSDLLDSASLNSLINQIQPDEIYNLAAQSHVAVSFKNPIYTTQTGTLGSVALLEAVRHSNNEIKYSEGERFISVKPSTLTLDIDFELKYSNPLIGNQRNVVKVYEDDLTDVFNSRTFCLYEDIELIKKNGLAKGGSLENAIVVKDKEILNPEGLRNDKEFVNHKILDCIGDLYTSGFRIVASITCSRGGHYLTNKLLRKIFQNKDNFSIIEIKEKNLPHTLINKTLLRSIA